MPTVTIRPGESDEETIPKTLGWERTRELGSMRRLLIDVDRRDVQQVTLNRKDDAVELDGVDNVRLVDIETGGSTWTLVCYSREWDANRAGFTDGGNLRTGDDQTLITDLVGEVSSWSPGTINSFTGNLSFVFNHAHRHEAIRRIEKNVPGEIQFRDEGTVDYVSELGTDRSGSVELSASAGTIEKEISIIERGRELDGTHFRVLGAHEGEAQLFANLVPSSDPASYTNRVNYTSSRWSPGDPKDWDRWVNKDVTEQGTIEEEAAALGDEVDETLVEAQTTVTTVDLEVGDYVQVVKPDANLDKRMRVHRVTEKSGRRNDTDSGATTVQDVLLSTRTILRTDDSSDLRDIQRFNSGYQGNSVWGTVSGGRQPVSSSNNYEFSFFYPEISYEHTAEAQVKGLNYRAYAEGAGAQGFTIADLVGTASLGSDTTLTPGDSTTITATVGSGYTGDTLLVNPEFTLDENDYIDVYVELFTASFTADLVETIRTDTLGRWSTVHTITDIESGDTIDFTIENPSYRSTNINLVSGASTEVDLWEPEHEHDASPGIVDFDGVEASPAHYPDNCDVLVNGNSQGVSFGDGTGEFEETVDITGALTTNSWNTIEITSGGLGHIIGAVGIDAYRQIGTQ